MRVNVDGDATAGFLVDIHDGDHAEVYSPTGCVGAAEAMAAAVEMHVEKFGGSIRSWLKAEEAEVERDLGIGADTEAQDTQPQQLFDPGTGIAANDTVAGATSGFQALDETADQIQAEHEADPEPALQDTVAGADSVSGDAAKQD